MIQTSIQKLSKDIGYDIGMSNDVVQSDLINGFSEALCNSMQSNEFNSQMCAIAKLLTPKSERVLIELFEYIKLKNSCIEEGVRSFDRQKKVKTYAE